MAIILPSLPRSPLLLLLLALVLLSSAHLPLLARAEESCSASAPCANNLCCSKWGWCGSTVDHCGAGCQSQCSGSASSPTPPPTTSPSPSPPPPSPSPSPSSASPPPPSASPPPPTGSAPPPTGSAPPPTGSAPPPTGSAPPPTGSAPPPTSSAPPPTGSPPPSTGLQRMAYFKNEAGMDPSLIPAANLTHVFYSSASLDPTTYKVVPHIPAIDVNEGLYLRFNSAVKTANPAIKTLLSIGGYFKFSTDFASATSSPSSRSAFIQSAIALARTYNFDGLDLNWEYPMGNTTLFSTLFTEFRAAIESEAAASGKSKLLLSATVDTLSYKEIEQLVTTGGYTAKLDAPTFSMYAVKGDQWVGYDDPSTITTKVQFAKAQGYGGWFCWRLDQDANNALVNAAAAAS
ncbi:unnamed protein product [Closterium sp. Naga37s-1]|nr:unnamed protein product [Closterium sp. Naga37s-1]